MFILGALKTQNIFWHNKKEVTVMVSGQLISPGEIALRGVCRYSGGCGKEESSEWQVVREGGDSHSRESDLHSSEKPCPSSAADTKDDHGIAAAVPLLTLQPKQLRAE